ncbi:hypothetical protein JNE12001_33500 [Escherichia coli]
MVTDRTIKKESYLNNKLETKKGDAKKHKDSTIALIPLLPIKYSHTFKDTAL